MRRGKFIVLDGNLGSGKTTMRKAAEQIYGNSVFFTREIGGSPFAEVIRHHMLSTEEGKQADAKTHFNLAWAARADHLKNEIIPRLEKGMDVLSDRFDSSTWAYQICAQDGHDLKELFWLERKVVLGSYIPDLYILLDVVPKTGMRRKADQADRDVDHFDERSDDFYEKSRAGFNEFFQKVPHTIIDANQPLEKVRTEFLSVLEKVFGRLQ